MNNIIYKIGCIIFIFICFSCKHKTDVEKMLISKNSSEYWTLKDYNSKKVIDIYNVPIVFKFKQGSVEQFFINQGEKIYPLDLELPRQKEEQWSYEEKNKILKIGESKYKVLKYYKDSLIVKDLDIDKLEVLFKFFLKNQQ